MEIVSIPITDVAPSRDEILDQQGVPAGTPVRPDIEDICANALELLNETAAPLAVTSAISQEEFADVFEGEGENDVDTPVGEILEQSEHLLLFAVTLGAETCSRIDMLFQANDFALACMLDSAASVAADKAAANVEQRFVMSLLETGWGRESSAALRYSPGYCGWNISGQKRLFEFLKPEQIRLSLRPSYLMEPLKSVTGVVLAGPKEMHEFAPSFPSCAMCETFSCRERIRALLAD